MQGFPVISRLKQSYEYELKSLGNSIQMAGMSCLSSS